MNSIEEIRERTRNTRKIKELSSGEITQSILDKEFLLSEYDRLTAKYEHDLSYLNMVLSALQAQLYREEQPEPRTEMSCQGCEYESAKTDPDIFKAFCRPCKRTSPDLYISAYTHKPK